MKYFLDTEFIEGFSIQPFRKKRHFIDMISIGIVCEDGRKMYMISKEYNYNDADDWVKEHVIQPLYEDWVPAPHRDRLTVKNFHKTMGFSNKMIAEEIERFCKDEPTFYAYYADYDWVLFCSLFGTMMNLPKGFPMYCRDLKQMLDESQEKRNRLKQYIDDSNGILSIHEESELLYPLLLTEHAAYPIQKNKHSALDDAIWNQKLFQFLKKMN